MKKIGLLFMPAWPTEMPPLGISYIGQVLEKSGHEVKIFDFNIQVKKLLEERFKNQWESHPIYWKKGVTPTFWTDNTLFKKTIIPIIEEYFTNFVEELKTYNFDIIGYSVYFSSLQASIYMSNLISDRISNITQIAGGPELLPYENKTINWLNDKRGIVAALYGRAEVTVVQLVNAIIKNQDLKIMPGLILPIQEEADEKFRLVRSTFGYKEINIDTLLPPSYNDFDLSLYDNKALPLLMSRGCVGNCTFCGENTMQKMDFRSPENIVHEIKHHISKHNIKRFQVIDSLINGSRKILRETCKLMIEQELDIQWSSFARVEKFMTLDFLKLMKKAGCNHLAYGIESGSDLILKYMKKGFTTKEASQVIKATYESGINVSANLIVGYPGETRKEFDETVDFINNHFKYITFINLSIFGLDHYSPIAKSLETYDIAINEIKGPIENLSIDKSIYSKNNKKYPYKDSELLDFPLWYSKDFSLGPAERKQRYNTLLNIITKNNILGNQF